MEIVKLPEWRYFASQHCTYVYDLCLYSEALGVNINQLCAQRQTGKWIFLCLFLQTLRPAGSRLWNQPGDVSVSVIDSSGVGGGRAGQEVGPAETGSVCLWKRHARMSKQETGKHWNDSANLTPDPIKEMRGRQDKDNSLIFFHTDFTQKNLQTI